MGTAGIGDVEKIGELRGVRVSMQLTDLYNKVPNISKHTKWYLDEIVYCLENYANVLSEEDAVKLVAESENLWHLVETEPDFLGHETPFEWAMSIKHGFGALWWHDDVLKQQAHDYVWTRHHPPMD